MSFDLVDTTPYCKPLLLKWIYTVSMDFLCAIFVIATNGIISYGFYELSRYQKQHTETERKEANFSLIFWVEFINMGIILTIVTTTNLPYFFSGLKSGWEMKYAGLTTPWYTDVGGSITITLLLNCVISNFIDI